MAKKKEVRAVELPPKPAVPVPITQTLETNFMPYAMSIIVSRALPEIDGFKPSHRKLLYTMYKMGLMTGARTKSANVVGATMRLNPHGDGAIYETMVRLARGCEALLHPFVDSKGNFGKAYSRDMAYAASRYTEVKLEPICAEIFKNIDADAVEFIDNYDNTMKEPALLPTTFPNILVSSNLGVAVGMTSNICGFNLAEVCETAIALIKDPDADILETLKAPDFPSGGELVYDRAALDEIYRTGRGSVRVRSVWKHDPKANCIEITEIPYSTSIEAIVDKVAELIKAGKIKEIADMRDETDKAGLKLTIDLKRGVDPEKLMARLMKLTPMCDSFSCNFNVLIAGTPRVLGVREILEEWTAWRTECIRRTVYHRLQKMKARLHLLKGLSKILLDIDKAIAIIRGTEEDALVVPNLMIGFGIDETQAEFIAEIKLRNINKAYILSRLEEIEALEAEITDAEETLASKKKLRGIIVSELKDVIKKYGVPRKTRLVYAAEVETADEEEDAVEDYPVHYFLSRDGYFKKITPQSLRMSGEQKFKEGDELTFTGEGSNADELLFFTNKQQVYKVKCDEMAETKASVLGTYLPQHLAMDADEAVCGMAVAPKGNYPGSLIFAYADGKCARVVFESYATKTNRKKLINAYSDKSPLVGILQLTEDAELALYSSADRAVVFSSALLMPKPTRDTQGVKAMTIKPKQTVVRLALADQTAIQNRSRYRARTIPAAGAIVKPEDNGIVQTTLE